jgi:hypothetical protein
LSSPSNLYAEKIYAEQPIALWALDDSCAFASYMPDSSLHLESWTRSGGTSFAAIPEDTDPYPKISGASYTELITSGNVTLTSPTTISSSVNFSAGMWVNPQTAITSIKFTVGSLSKEFVLTGREDEWIYLSHIFEVSSPVTGQNFVIDITHSGIAATVYLNGFSIGINQHLYGASTVGVQLESAIGSLYGVEAFEYGLGQHSGWYIGNNSTKKLYATQSSMPLVYGANLSTKIIKNPDGPSLVVPGMGFLNQSAKAQTLVFEAWMRIRTDGRVQTSPSRIMGPIASADGLYVDGQNLILKVGKSYASHYVGEWFRPMLVNIEYTEDNVNLFINGELVAFIAIDAVDLSSIDDDYIGFYVNGNIEYIDIDCIAVYPYRMTPVLAKRRFGYGQAVSLPSEIETAYSGKQIQIDYTFAGYSSDYSYPKIESWSSSTSENMSIVKNTMGSPKHIKPTIVLSDTLMKSLQDTSKWESDQATANAVSDTYPFIKMNPTSEWDGINGYMYLSSMRQGNLPIPASFFVVCEANSSYSDKDQVVFRIQDKENLDSVSAVLSGTTLTYAYNVRGSQGIFATKTVSSGAKFVAGIDFVSILSSNDTPTYVKRFLLSRSRLSLFFGGDYAGSDASISTTFMGKIYKASLCSGINYVKQEMSSLFVSGIATVTNVSQFMALKSSYEFSLVKQSFASENVYTAEVSSMSYWQDYIPLSKFAKQITLENGTVSYVTDMIQISLDVAQSSKITSGKIDSSSMNVKTYVYFFNSQTARLLASFSENVGMSTVLLNSNKVIDARSSWMNKRFEVVDGTVILPPQTGQSDIYMATVVETYTKSVDRLPVKIRSIEYAAQTFNRKTSPSFNKVYAKKIGTRSQTSDIYMYAESAGTYDYSAYNPVAISKTMSPYLYLTNKTGIKVLDSYSTSNDRGIYIPVNPNADKQYVVSLLSMYLLFNDQQFSSEMTIAEVYDVRYSKLRIVAKATNDSKVAKISVLQYVSGSWVELSNIEMYVNGVYTASPTISAGEWANIGILFISNPLDFSNSSEHKIEIVGSILVNNISYYQLRPEELAQQLLPNEWNDYDTEYLWSQTDTEKTWSQIAASEAFTRPELSPQTISKIYSGTNRILATSDTDLSGISLTGYKYDVINDIVWQNSINIVT